jgi:hypothetical protein
MIEPPEKREGDFVGRPLTHAGHYERRQHAVVPATAQERNRALMFFQWKAEAERLLREFWHTGRLSHLAAFIVHIIAMRRQLERAQS